MTMNQPKQTAIPGTEAAVYAAEARERCSRPQFETRPAKQRAFISGLGRDLPGQQTLFDPDGLEE